MINKDVVFWSVILIHLTVFISLMFLTDIDNLDSIAVFVNIAWGIALVASKKIKRLNEWYEKPFGGKKTV